MLYRLLLLTCCLCSLSMSGQSQTVDAKLTLGGLFANTTKFGVEIGLSKKVSLEIAPGVYYSLLGDLGIDQNRFSGYLLGANFRFYTKPTEKGLDRFFLAPYARIVDGRIKWVNDDVVNDEFTFRRSSFGLMFGYKELFKGSRLFFEVSCGLGYVANLNFVDLAPEDQNDFLEKLFSTRVDLQSSIMIGYRFGGKKRD